MTTLSLDTLMLSIKAVQRDIARHEQRLAADGCSEEDAEYYGQYVVDLSRALSELGSLYNASRAEHAGSPSLDELLGDG